MLYETTYVVPAVHVQHTQSFVPWVTEFLAAFSQNASEKHLPNFQRSSLDGNFSLRNSFRQLMPCLNHLLDIMCVSMYASTTSLGGESAHPRDSHRQLFAQDLPKCIQVRYLQKFQRNCTYSYSNYYMAGIVLYIDNQQQVNSLHAEVVVQDCGSAILLKTATVAVQGVRPDPAEDTIPKILPREIPVIIWTVTDHSVQEV